MVLGPQPASKRPGFESAEELAQWLVTMVALARNLHPSEVGLHSSFVELGFDSLSAVALAGSLEDRLGVEVPATLLWEVPTVGELAPHLWSLISSVQNSGRHSA